MQTLHIVKHLIWEMGNFTTSNRDRDTYTTFGKINKFQLKKNYEPGKI